MGGSGRKVDPKKKSFDEAIVILVTVLSEYYDGRWFTIKDMRTLLVAGGIEENLTEVHIINALRCNKSRFAQNRYGSKSVLHYRPVATLNTMLPCRQNPLLPTIAADFFLSADFVNEVSNIQAYFMPATAPAWSQSTPHPIRRLASSVTPSPSVPLLAPLLPRLTPIIYVAFLLG
jgi:hypothetical protein